ncbi:hypothetical protein EDB83DRAFT_2320269 [Lactarius deliciosus]|nr:hypothetical protein EDB83DRAFT_2320269 [Lactarius deliciosus]
MFTDGFGFLSCPEYGRDDTIFEACQDQDLQHSFHLTQLKRSSLHLEKCLVKQKIEEHEITLQVLKEQMSNIEEHIASTTSMVDRLHCFMDCVGVSIPDLPDHIAASIFLSESPSLKRHRQGDRISRNSHGETFVEENKVFGMYLNFLSFPALDSHHAARECESNWLQHQVDYFFRPRDDPHAHRYGDLSMQTPVSHLSDGQHGVQLANRRLTQPPTGPMATVPTQPQANQMIKRRYSKKKHLKMR